MKTNILSTSSLAASLVAALLLISCSGGGGSAGSTSGTGASASSPGAAASSPTTGASGSSGGQGSGNPGGGITQVSNGLPNQKSMTLSAEKYGLDWNLNGDLVKVTVQVANTAGNPVPDGTTVQFSAEGGQVVQACNLKGTVVGSSTISACSVDFVVQNPRPYDGAVTVIAWLQGQEAFNDLNGNGQYDANEPFYDSGIPYRDDNLNSQYDSLSDSLVIPGAAAPGTAACITNNVYLNQAPSSIPNTCNGAWGNGYVSAQIAFPLTQSSSIGLSSLGGGSFKLFSTYTRNDGTSLELPAPSGTTLTAQPRQGSTCTFGTSFGGGNIAKEPPNFNSTTLQYVASVHSINVTNLGLNGCTGGVADVTATFGSKSVTVGIPF